jgi:hypothetical protein
MRWALALIFLLPQDDLKSDFDKLHSELCPKKTEKWLTIPWKVRLLEARDLAAKEGKPLFIWSMNGHPLGCG